MSAQKRRARPAEGAPRVGVLLPTREAAMTGRHDATALVALAVRAERAGFDSVWTGDSPLARTRVDPVALLAAVSAVTTVAVGTAALVARCATRCSPRMRWPRSTRWPSQRSLTTDTPPGCTDHRH